MFRSKALFFSLFIVFIYFSVSNPVLAQSKKIEKKNTTHNPTDNKTNLSSKKEMLDSAQISGGYTANHTQIKLLAPEKLTKDYTDALKQILNLSNAQYDKMLQVNRALIDKIDALVYNSKDYASFIQGVKLADKARMDKYKVFLTPTQFKTYSVDSSLSGLNKVNLNSNVQPGNPIMK